MYLIFMRCTLDIDSLHIKAMQRIFALSLKLTIIQRNKYVYVMKSKMLTKRVKELYFPFFLLSLMLC